MSTGAETGPTCSKEETKAMKTTALTLLAALTVATAVAGPVLAQPYGGPPPSDYRHDGDRPNGDRPYGDRDHMDRGGDRRDGDQRGGAWGIERRLDWMQERITRGQQDGSLSRREAYRVQSQLNRIKQDVHMSLRMHEGRMDERMQNNLQMRLDRLNDQIRWLRHNDQARPW